MLFVLAGRREAPASLVNVSRKGVPANAILASTVVGFLCVIAAAISPTGVFLFLLSSSGAVILFVYGLIAVSQLVLRRRTDAAKLRLKMWLFPYLTIAAIVAMLADDPLGAAREDMSVPVAGVYRDAFRAIDSDPNQYLAVMTDDGTVVGTLQLTFIAGLSRRGALRGQIEAVRVAAGHRGCGLGQRLFEWAIAECRDRGCRTVQLTTDKSRADAHRFYDRLGFKASHIGYKLSL